MCFSSRGLYDHVYEKTRAGGISEDAADSDIFRISLLCWLLWMTPGLYSYMLKTATVDKLSHRCTCRIDGLNAKSTVESIGCLNHFMSGEVIDFSSILTLFTIGDKTVTGPYFTNKAFQPLLSKICLMPLELILGSVGRAATIGCV